MKLYKTKIGRIINFIKNENKFEFGDMVKVLSVADTTDKYFSETNIYYQKYKKYVWQFGYITSIDYTKKDYIFGVKFEDGKSIDFKANELEKIKPENPLFYKKLNIQI